MTTHPPTETVDMRDLAIGDRIIRPWHDTIETVTAIGPDPHRGPRTTYLRADFASGHSWTHSRAYRVRRLLP